MRGRLIVLEGIDGSGKTTLGRALAQSLGAVFTAEPSEGFVGDALRRAGEEEGHPLLEALLFVADRAHHTHRMVDWLEEGRDVVCDRYYASTLAYQTAALGEGLRPWLRELNDKVIIRPDATLLLDIDPDEGMARVNSRGGTSKFEKLGYLREVRRQYLRLAEEDGFIIIDASRSQEQVLDEALTKVKEILEMV